MSTSLSTDSTGSSPLGVTPPSLTFKRTTQKYPQYHTTSHSWLLLTESSIYQRLRSTGQDRLLVKDWAGNLKAFHTLHDHEKYQLSKDLVRYLLSGQVYEHGLVRAFPEDYPLDFTNMFGHHFKPTSTPDYRSKPEYPVLFTTATGFTYINSRRPTETWSSFAATHQPHTTSISRELHEAGVQRFADEFFEERASRRWNGDRKNDSWQQIPMWVGKHDLWFRELRVERVQFDRSETNGMRDGVFLDVDDLGQDGRKSGRS